MQRDIKRERRASIATPSNGTPSDQQAKDSIHNCGRTVASPFTDDDSCSLSDVEPSRQSAMLAAPRDGKRCFVTLAGASELTRLEQVGVDLYELQIDGRIVLLTRAELFTPPGTHAIDIEYISQANFWPWPVHPDDWHIAICAWLA